MAWTREDLSARLKALCTAPPLPFTLAPSPFDFDTMPTTTIDLGLRVEVASQGTVGGMNFSEDRTDLVTIWIARKQLPDPQTAYQSLLADVTSLTSALVHDGAEAGDYAVLDGVEVSVAHDTGQEFAVAQLRMPINYEATL